MKPPMKVRYDSSIHLNDETLFHIIQEYMKEKLGEEVANVHWNDTATGMTAEVQLCSKLVEIKS